MLSMSRSPLAEQTIMTRLVPKQMQTLALKASSLSTTNKFKVPKVHNLSVNLVFLPSQPKYEVRFATR